MIKFRPLRADEVDLRVDRYTQKGAWLLCYKDARCDMRILDETVGAENWQREHYECKGNLFCRVGIRIGDDWVWKADCGTESYTEKEKGESSDSFKRACFCWGIGRELYTKINIFIPMKTQKNDKGKYEPIENKDKFARFYTTEMEVHGERITYLLVSDDSGKPVFSYGQPCEPQEDITETCEGCGHQIVPVRKRDGSMWSVREMSEYSQMRFEKKLCAECMKKASAEEKSNENKAAV